MAKKKDSALLDENMSTNGDTDEAPGLDPKVREELKRRGFVPLSGSSKVGKWSKGQVVEGRYCGLKKAKYGFLFSVEVEDGIVETWPASKALEPTLAPIALGTEIYVECVGTKPSDYTNDMWIFEVYAKNNPAMSRA